jgi:uncharacterized membrane protein
VATMNKKIIIAIALLPTVIVIIMTIVGFNIFNKKFKKII